MLTAAILTILLVACIVAAAVIWSRWRSAEARGRGLETNLEAERRAAATAAQSAAAEAERFAVRVSELEAAVARLAQWEGVADASEAAAAMIRDTRIQVDGLVAEAKRQREEAEAEIGRLRQEAAVDVHRVRSAAADEASERGRESARIIAEADARATLIVADAEQKAQALAGDALRAVRDAAELERTVRALENTVAGYGNRYIIPSHALLDDLAEGFGHTEAGQNLKATRDRIRDMVRAGRAAACDYVERERREIAIRFVTDAFNGKADTILAEVRHDNAGTLQQRLRDAFSLVNVNGKAFRNARITDEYLAARLEELRWAAVANELKLQEREEQRRIKEQIREEEKARREYERAIREAAKEEELLRRAMAKAEEQMARASDAQRAKYEGQLAELTARLREAEERNRRALSMAQQTRRGHVYVISNVGSFGEHVYKIGLTRRLEPLDRIRELGDSSVPFEFDVHALIFADDAPALEHQLHRHFVLTQINKVNHRKEFFRTELAHIRSEIEALGLTAQWTMTAAAREHRETLAIEEVIRANPAARDAWVNRQLLLDMVSDPFAADEEPPDAGMAVSTSISPVELSGNPENSLTLARLSGP